MWARAALPAVVSSLLCAALAWSLLRFGATPLPAFHAFFLALAAAGLVAFLGLRREVLDARSWLPLVLVGGFLLAQAALRPTLAAEGYVHLAAGWLALALALWVGASGRAAAKVLFVFLILVGVAEAGFAVLELRGTVEALARNPEIQPDQAIGTLINPNHFAGLVNMGLALTIGALAVPLAGERRGRRRLRPLAALPILAAVGFMAYAVYRAKSHGGTVAGIAALTWMALLAVLRRRGALTGTGPSRRTVVALALVGLAVAAAAGVGVARSGVLSLQHRAEVYRDTATMIAERPILGVGPGLYQWRFRPYQTVNLEGHYHHAHNDYLQTAAEWGIPLALLFWAFLGWRALGAARTWLLAGDPWTRAIALGSTGAIATILVHSLVDFNLQIPSNLVVFATIVGASWSLEIEPRVPASRRAETATRLLTRVGLPALLLLAAGSTSLRLAALEAARKFPGVEGLESALRFDSRNPEHHFRLGLLARDDLSSQDFSVAREHLERAVALNPYAWRYPRELGQLYELLGLEERAAAAYGKALALNPRSPEYRFRAANARLRAGDLEGALPLFAAVLVERPGLRIITLDVLLASGAELGQVEAIWPRDPVARAQLERLLSWRERRLERMRRSRRAN